MKISIVNSNINNDEKHLQVFLILNNLNVKFIKIF